VNQVKKAWGVYMKSDIDKAVEAEKERCAKKCDELAHLERNRRSMIDMRKIEAYEAMAEAIRARGSDEKETLKNSNDERNDNTK